VRLLEHHIFWSRRSLEHIAASTDSGSFTGRKAGTRAAAAARFRGVVSDALKTGLYCVAGPQYASIAQAFRQARQPALVSRSPSGYFQACLMRA